MSLLILDSSATLAWIYGDETTEAIRRVFDAIADNGALVPVLWRLEVANSLTMAVRKRRIDPISAAPRSQILLCSTSRRTRKLMPTPGRIR